MICQLLHRGSSMYQLLSGKPCLRYPTCIPDGAVAITYRSEFVSEIPGRVARNEVNAPSERDHQRCDHERQDRRQGQHGRGVKGLR